MGNMVSIREYATMRGVSYESVRIQLRRFADELEGHIYRQGNARFLDEDAVKFLDNHRNIKTVTVIEDRESFAELKAEIEQLNNQILALSAELTASQKMTIDLLNDKTALLEDRTRAEADRAIMEVKLDSAEHELKLYEERLTAAAQTIEEQKTEIDSFEKSVFGFYRKRK